MVRGSDILIALIAIIFPPAAVAMMTGCSCDLMINIALTLLGYLPGHIHAFWILYKKMRAEEMYGATGYIYVGNGEYQPSNDPRPPPPHYGQNYGATGQRY
ncbi:uncharacterized protein COLE_01592 [Cutaneotrichosporon oleaginosum]|uniref:uncharacterized protein n=1 Tax=Cutaneotrichosporon oleaginosum TaxID=879819 RepID=UPI001321A08C|nr:hypothetical protein COLE_01592 [Cutaneotrichosporon oleaginosum]